MLKEASTQGIAKVCVLLGLNPYFNGTCSKSGTIGCGLLVSPVGLNPYFNGTCSKRAEFLLGLGYKLSLNPYFNGTCSKRRGERVDKR